MTKSIEQLVTETSKLLLQHRLKLATAESCTGGGLSYWLTTSPGSSDWFERGFVTYSNAAKIDLLGVSAATLAQSGAVSAETASAMAEGALQNSQAEVSIAITGIAGPSGGTAEKPIGTVWIAWAQQDRPTQTECYVFTGDRQAIRTRAIEQALTGLLGIFSH